MRSRRVGFGFALDRREQGYGRAGALSPPRRLRRTGEHRLPDLVAGDDGTRIVEQDLGFATGAAGHPLAQLSRNIAKQR